MAEQLAMRRASAGLLLSRKTAIWLLVALLCAAAMWGYVAWVLAPHQVSDAAAQGTPRGNLSDLYPRWLGSREMLLRGSDPYSLQVTQQIQLGYYGVVLDPNNPAHPTDQQGFAYPVYVAFLLAPTLWLPFDMVQEGFGWLLALVTALAVPLWAQALRLKLSPTTLAVTAVLTLGSFAAVQGLALQQLTLLMVFLLAAALALLAREKLFLAGALLAVTTIKPQLVAPLLLGLAIWTLFDLKRRQGLIWGFVVVMAALLIGAEIVQPGWLPRFIAALGDYQRYTKGVSLLSTFLGPFIGTALSAVLLVLALGFWLRAAREKTAGPAFANALAFTFCVTLLVIPTWAPYNQVLLLPALLLLVDHARIAWQKGGRWTRYAFLFAGITIAWPWIAAALLALASGVALLTGGNLRAVQDQWTWPLYSALFIPIAVLLALGAVLRLRESPNE